MFKWMSLAVAAAMALAVPAQAEKKTIPGGILQSFGVKIDGVGQLDVLSELSQAKGVVVVCGLYLITDGSSSTTKAVSDQALQAVYFTLDGKDLGINAKKFKRYDSIEAAKAARDFGCVATKRKVEAVRDPKSFKMRLSLGSVRY